MTSVRLGGQVWKLLVAVPFQTSVESPKAPYSNLATLSAPTGAMPSCRESDSVTWQGPSVPARRAGALGSLAAAGTPTGSEDAAEAISSDTTAAPAPTGARPRTTQAGRRRWRMGCSMTT